ncbi:uncharacterized protein [Aegilops tauschii subsp. strangulata]|uniref:uncharacterized protein isoform X1 n=1 Tax=Aegilops tauschii subsp. strangulata TaxID=200361 RepID=UPI003CC8403E
MPDIEQTTGAAQDPIGTRPDRQRLPARSSASARSLAPAMDPYKHRPTSEANSGYWTTNSGAPVWNNNNTLTVVSGFSFACWSSAPDAAPGTAGGLEDAAQAQGVRGRAAAVRQDQAHGHP